MSPLIWTQRARADLRGIGDYIAQRDPAAAARFIGELMDRALVLKKLPRSGRKVPECAKEAIRELIHGNYRIVYRIDEDALRILTVFEGHMLLRPPLLETEGEGMYQENKDDEE